MQPRLIILSDLWGEQKSEWIQLYIEKLALTFDVKFYDCCDLGQIDTEVYTEKHLHQQFVSFGIDNTVQKLIELEKEPFHLLAFSIGATIAWKAALLGLPLITLHAISATRLRHETNIPKIPIQLYFGMNDAYTPSKDWCNQFNTENIILFDSESHEMYKKEEIAVLVCESILKVN